MSLNGRKEEMIQKFTGWGESLFKKQELSTTYNDTREKTLLALRPRHFFITSPFCRPFLSPCARDETKKKTNNRIHMYTKKIYILYDSLRWCSFFKIFVN